MRRSAPINLIVYHPTTLDERIELAKRVAEVHSSAVVNRLKYMNIPTSQKLEMMDAVIQTVRDRR